MTEQEQPVTEEQPTTEQSQEQPSLNTQAKELPWVKELMSAKKELDDFKAAQSQAAKDAELKKAEEEGRYQDVLKAKEAELEQLKSGYEKQILESNLKSELIKAGFSNDMFINGAINGYDPESAGDISAYVGNLASNESNKAFLGSSEPRTVHNPPAAVPGKSVSQNWEQVKAWEKSGTREERIKARELIKAHREATGKYPY